MEIHIDQLRIKSRLSLVAYVKGLKENNMVKKINFIYLSDEVFKHVIQGLLAVDGVFGVEPKENIIGKEIEGVYCKLIKGTDWEKEIIESIISDNGISTIDPNIDYRKLGTMYKKSNG